MNPKDDRHALGQKGEALVRDYLIGNGYEILEKNYKYGKNEIDIICKIENIIVFVEVRSRGEHSTMNLEYSITAKKQKSIFLVANHYVDTKKIKNVDFRFDVVFVHFEREEDPIEHFKNALMFF
jgi:putative endonuclease